MAFKIIKAKELQKQITVNMLVYGPPGVGKTTFASTAPKPLIIDLENGTMSLLGRDVDVAQVETLSDAREAIKYALNNGYKTVVIDSITRYAELQLEEILRENKRDTARIQDWGEVVKRIKKLIWTLQSKSINTIFIVLETEEKDEESLVKRPAVPGQLKVAIPAIVDIVGYMRIRKGGERVVSVKPSPKWYAKDRSGKLPDEIKPDFSYILSLIREEKHEAKNPVPELDQKYIKAIHSWANLAGVDHKEIMAEKFGKTTSKELTEQEAKELLNILRERWAEAVRELGYDVEYDLGKPLAEIKYKEAKEYTSNLEQAAV